MSETDIVEAMNEGLASLGVEDTVEVAGQFQPRGTSGALFSGGCRGIELEGSRVSVTHSKDVIDTLTH